jgi:hypothetical protein
MKSTRTSAGNYTITCHTRDHVLVQYEVKQAPGGWTVSLVYGDGPLFNGMIAETKGEALRTLRMFTY